MKSRLQKMFVPMCLSVFVATWVPALANARGSVPRDIELEVTTKVPPSDILCEDVESCRLQGDICTDEDCVLVFRVPIPLRNGETALMTEYIHSQNPLGDGSRFYVDCHRKIEFPWGSVTARYDTLFKVDSVDSNNLIFARLASLGSVTGGTGYYSGASGFSSVSGDGTADGNTQWGNPVDVHLEIEFEFDR